MQFVRLTYISPHTNTDTFLLPFIHRNTHTHTHRDICEFCGSRLYNHSSLYPFFSIILLCTRPYAEISDKCGIELGRIGYYNISVYIQSSIIVGLSKPWLSLKLLCNVYNTHTKHTYYTNTYHITFVTSFLFGSNPSHPYSIILSKYPNQRKQNCCYIIALGTLRRSNAKFLRISIILTILYTYRKTVYWR